jgi:hypothetical protein
VDSARADAASSAALQETLGLIDVHPGVCRIGPERLGDVG